MITEMMLGRNQREEEMKIVMIVAMMMATMFMMTMRMMMMMMMMMNMMMRRRRLRRSLGNRQPKVSCLTGWQHDGSQGERLLDCDRRRAYP